MKNVPTTAGTMIWTAICLLSIPAVLRAEADMVIDDFEATPERWGPGLKLDTVHHKEGRSSLHWPADRRTRIALEAVPRDWSAFRVLSFWCYSEKATGNQIVLSAGSDNPKTPGGDYYSFIFTIDWTGWKRIEIPFSRMGAARHPRGWDQIDNLAFYSSGWGQAKPIPGTSLFLDDLRLSEWTAAESAELRRQRKDLRRGRIIRLNDSEDLLEYLARGEINGAEYWQPQPAGGCTLRQDWNGLTLLAAAPGKSVGIRREYDLDLSPWSTVLVQARTSPGNRLRVTLEGDENRCLGTAEQDGKGVPTQLAIGLGEGTRTLKAIRLELLPARKPGNAGKPGETTLEWIKLRRPERPRLAAFTNLTRAVMFRMIRPPWGAATYRLLRSKASITASSSNAVHIVTDAIPAATPVLFDFPPGPGEWHYALAPLSNGTAGKPGPEITVRVAAADPPVIRSLTHAPVIDGDLADWAAEAEKSKVSVSGPRSVVSGDVPKSPADLSGTAIFAHDATRFYVGVTVRDDVVRHENPYSWQGDGVVVLFRFSPPNKDRSLARYDLVLNCTAGGDARILEDRTGTYPADAKPVAPGKWAVRRTESGYTVEGAIPLEALRTVGFRKGMRSFGLGLVLFDADQTSGRTQRQTIASWNQHKQTYAADEAALVKWEQVR